MSVSAFGLSPEPFGDSVHITIPENITSGEVVAALASAGLPGAEIREILPGIEDVFLELMKKEVGGLKV